MFRHTWPFPEYDEIVQKYPDLSIDKKIYNAAKDFYLGTLEAEVNRLNEFIRATDRAEEEREFIATLVKNAVHVGICQMKPGKKY